MQQKNFNHKVIKINTYKSKYQSFQIKKFSSFKLIMKKVKKVSRKGFVYAL